MKYNFKLIAFFVISIIIGLSLIACDLNGDKDCTVCGEAICICVTVTGVTINIEDSKTSVEKGQTLQFIATVLGTNITAHDVTWSIITAEKSEYTAISAIGLLTVDYYEENSSITIRATSILNNARFNDISVELTAPSGPPPTVDDVTVTAANGATSVVKGKILQLSAAVTVTNNAPQKVQWSIIEADKHTDTTISAGGLLFVNLGEINSSLTIRATSTFDNEKYDEITISLNEPPELSWERTSLQTGNRGVAFGNDKFVVTGSDLFFSAGGSNWTKGTVTVPPQFAGSSSGIAFGNNRWVSAIQNRIDYSDDGENWTHAATGTSIGFYIESVAYGGTVGTSRWVAVGQFNNTPGIAYSGTGQTWTSLTSGIPFSNNIRGVAYGDGKWIAVGHNGRIAHTVNASGPWTSITENPFRIGLSTTDIYCIAYGNSKWVIGGANGKMAFSDDGLEWTEVLDSTFGSSAIRSVAYGNGKWVAVGADGKMAYSDDGESWRRETNSPLTGLINGIAYGNNRWIAVGQNGITCAIDTSSSNAPSVTGVIVNPSTASVSKGRNINFTATVSGTNFPPQGVIWSIDESVNTGTHILNGVLTVALTENLNQLTIRATSVYEPNWSGTTTVTLLTPAVTGITIDQSTATIEKGFSDFFTATVNGTNNPPQDVSWSIDEAVHEGTYIASSYGSEGAVLVISSYESRNSITIRATSNFDNTKSGTAVITIIDPVPVVYSVSLNPDSVIVSRGNTETFTATVNGTNNPPQDVSWSIAETNRHSGTTILNGVLTVSADENLTSLTIRATSTYDNTKSGEAIVTISIDNGTSGGIASQYQKSYTSMFFIAKGTPYPNATLTANSIISGGTTIAANVSTSATGGTISTFGTTLFTWVYIYEGSTPIGIASTTLAGAIQIVFGRASVESIVTGWASFSGTKPSYSGISDDYSGILQ